MTFASTTASAARNIETSFRQTAGGEAEDSGPAMQYKKMIPNNRFFLKFILISVPTS
jgi:hypothetical protein